MKHDLRKYIYIKIESIRMLDCTMFSIFNKRVFSIFKTLWLSVLKTAGSFAKQFWVMPMAKHQRRLLKASLPPARRAPQQPRAASYRLEKKAAATTGIHHYRDPALSAVRESAPQGQLWRSRTRERQKADSKWAYPVLSGSLGNSDDLLRSFPTWVNPWSSNPYHDCSGSQDLAPPHLGQVFVTLVGFQPCFLVTHFHL